MQNKKVTSADIQSINRNDIFQLLYQKQALSKQGVMAILNISLPTVTQNINRLMEEGLVCESGSIGNTGGRRAKTYDIVADARFSIGLDITRRHVSIVVIDLRGNFCYHKRVEHPFSTTDEYYHFLGTLVQEAVTVSQAEPSKILGVGIGVPGLITKDGKSVYYGKILDFSGVTLEDFSRYIPYPTAIYNDADAAAIAEFHLRPDLQNAFYILLSTNVGGVVVIDGKIYPGDISNSAKVGHLRIVPNGRTCYCGQRGCVDAYCSATVLSSLTGGNLDSFFNLLKQNDPDALKIWNQYLDHLALAIINVYLLFGCTIILGGYVGSYLDEYIDELRLRVQKLATIDEQADFLEICLQKNESIAVGAALSYISSFLLSI